MVIPHVIALHFRFVLADAASPMTLEEPALQYNHTTSPYLTQKRRYSTLNHQQQQQQQQQQQDITRKQPGAV